MTTIYNYLYSIINNNDVNKSSLMKPFNYEDEYNKKHKLDKYAERIIPNIEIPKPFNYEDEYNKKHGLGKYANKIVV